MSIAKIAVTIDQNLLARLDRLVKERRYPCRSRILQEALRDKLERLECSRLLASVRSLIHNWNSSFQKVRTRICRNEKTATSGRGFMLGAELVHA